MHSRLNKSKVHEADKQFKSIFDIGFHLPKHISQGIQMNNKVALIVGGTGGIGLSIVKALVKNNYDVYFIGFNKAKGENIELELKNENNKLQKNVIRFIQLDLSNLKAVRQFAYNFCKLNTRLDLLVFAAGVILPTRQETKEGIEKTLATGYLSTYLLCQSLESLLEKGKNPRILTVGGSSQIVLRESLDFNDFNNTEHYNGFKASTRTVHARVVLTHILAEQLSVKGIDVNTFHPGLIKSDMGRHYKPPLNWIFKLSSLISTKETKTGVYASLAVALNGITNQFLHRQSRKPLQYSYDYKQQLLEQTERLLSDAGFNPGFVADDIMALN